MIIDEVKTGFRVARGGVQELFGVKADLCTFAKAMGNGYPISRAAAAARTSCASSATASCTAAPSPAIRSPSPRPRRRCEILAETPALATHRRLRHEAARRHEPDPLAARHQALLQRPSVDERPVLQRKAAARLPRLGHERLHFLRSTGAAPARPRRALRARLARALVRLRGARRPVPGGDARALRDGRGSRGEQRAAAGSRGAATKYRPDGLELGEIRRDRHRRGPQRPDQRRLSRALRAQGAGASSAIPGSAARRSAARSRRAGSTRTAPTSAACCARSSSATSNSRATACRSCPTAAASRSRRTATSSATTRTSDVQRREFARHNPRDADAYHRYSTDVMRQCKFIRPLLLRTPPDPTSFKPRDLREMLFLGREFNKLGEQFIYDTLRFYTMSIADFLDEYFESDVDQGHLVGQRHHRHGAWASTRPARPTCCCTTTWATSTARSAPGVSRAAAWARCRRRSRAAFKSYGGEIVTDAPVERVLVTRRPRHRRGDSTNGDEYHADIVVSNLDPKRTFRSSSTRRTCRPAFVEKARNFKIRGSSGKLNIALDGLPEFPALGTRQPAALTATCISSIRSSRWSAPTTTGRTAPGRRTRTSTC